MVAAWMNSQGHRENVLRPQFREIGFGVAPGNPRSTNGFGATYTTVFGVIGDPDAAPAPEVEETTQVADTQATAKKKKAKAAKRRAAKRRKAKAARATRHRKAQLRATKSGALRAHTSVG